MNTDDVFLREALKAKEAECERLADQVKRQAEEIERLNTRFTEAREALVKCADPQRWHAPCVSCGPKLVEAGCYIARAALAKLEGGRA